MEHIKYETDDRLAIITLARPERRNAQNGLFLAELDECWSRAAADPEIRVIVLKAEGPHFSAGHDMSGEDGRVGTFDYENMGVENQYHWEHENYLGFSRRWRDNPKPSIAAVQGRCIAAGLMLCWPCDLIVAAEDARFSDPVVTMGIGGVEYHGHTWEFGARKAKELLFTGEDIDAHEAKQLGMVNRVVPNDRLVEETLALARKIAEKPAFGVYQAKRAVNQTLDVMGFYTALQSVFDVHEMGHANALATSGQAVLANLEAMKKSQRK